MFEAFIITLREGVEAALVLAIASSLLRRRGLERQVGALLWGAALALVASAAIAWLATRLTWNEDFAEGIAMLVGSVLVVTLVIWMWKVAPGIRHEIEAGLDRAADTRGFLGGPAGIFLFGFGMVLREGAETAVFLSAAGFNSQGLGLWIGGLAGFGIAVAFGVLFARGALRVPLKPFFSLTSAVLLLIALQLLVGGLHELSEAQFLPSSRSEMALIGPLVKNDLLMFTLTVALAAGWLLFGPRDLEPAATSSSGPEARLARAARQRDQARRRWTGIVGLLVVGFLATAFAQKSKLPGKAPALTLRLENGVATLGRASLSDGHLHFYEVALPEGPVRFFALRVGGELRTCFDACEICGDKGYFEDGESVVCRNCTSPIARGSIGRTGGCNPIPLVHGERADSLTIRESDLRAALPRLRGHR